MHQTKKKTQDPHLVHPESVDTYKRRRSKKKRLSIKTESCGQPCHNPVKDSDQEASGLVPHKDPPQSWVAMAHSRGHSSGACVSSV